MFCDFLARPWKSASQNKHRRSANRQLETKQRCARGSGQNQPSLFLRHRPPFLALLTRSAQLSAAQPPNRGRHGLSALSSRFAPGLASAGTPSGRSRVLRGPAAAAQSWGPARMRLSPATLRLSRSPALLALALPLAAALAFSDETLDKVPKSEGYCSRILRAQGTRREGYTEFSLRVEGDPDFYKPGHSYRGKWPSVAWGVAGPGPRGALEARCGRRAHSVRAHSAGAARQGPSCPGCPQPF